MKKIGIFALLIVLSFLKTVDAQSIASTTKDPSSTILITEIKEKISQDGFLIMTDKEYKEYLKKEAKIDAEYKKNYELEQQYKAWYLLIQKYTTGTALFEINVKEEIKNAKEWVEIYIASNKKVDCIDGVLLVIKELKKDQKYYTQGSELEKWVKKRLTEVNIPY